MFKRVKAKNLEDYLTAVPEKQQELMQFLHTFIQKSAPKLKPYFAYNMLGYGAFPWRNAKHEPITWPVIALANQKNYVSLYVCAVIDGKYVAETYKKELGNVDVGKSCIRFKKIEDVNLPALKQVIQLAAKHPGFESLDTSKKKKK